MSAQAKTQKRRRQRPRKRTPKRNTNKQIALTMREGRLNPYFTPKVPGRRLDRARANSFLTSSNYNFSAKEREMIIDYCCCMYDPDNYMSRIPDLDSIPTALARSITTIPIYATFSGTADGNFAVVAKPFLGKDTDDPNDYKVGLVASSLFNLAPGAVNWKSPLQYIQNSGGENIRTDKYIHQLTSGPTGFFGLETGGGSSSATAPFGIDPVEDPLNDGRVITFKIDGGGLSPTISGNPGVYLMTIYMSQASPTFSPSPSTLDFGPTAEADTASAPTGTAYYINAQEDWSIRIGSSGASADAWLTVVPTAMNGIPGWEDGGAISLVRPVAMTMLFTPALSALTNGGMVAAALVPGGTCRNNWYDNVSNDSVGQLQDWEKIDALKSDKYSGEIKHGAWVRYKPTSGLDIQYFTPEDSLNYHYPCGIIAGVVSNQGNSLTGTVFIGRLRVVTVYEFQTNVSLWETRSHPGTTALYEAALKVMALEPTAFENGKHLDAIKSFLARVGRAASAVGQFAYDNRDVLIPAAKNIAKFALA